MAISLRILNKANLIDQIQNNLSKYTFTAKRNLLKLTLKTNYFIA